MDSETILSLDDVTVCAVDTINPLAAARALDCSMSQCKFGDAILFTHNAVSTRARFIKIGELRSIHDYSAFVIKQIVHHIITPWVLIVQWDGYVVDASQWHEEFRAFDYIGARWIKGDNGILVGNGGFSLRSARLLAALADDRLVVPPNAVEDVLICRIWRAFLEQEYNIRVAPIEVANRFSYEHTVPENRTFGFHGINNMWRHVDQVAMSEIIRGLDMRTLSTAGSLVALVNYCALRQFTCAKALYDRYRSCYSAAELVDLLVDTARVGTNIDRDAARRYVETCERL